MQKSRKVIIGLSLGILLSAPGKIFAQSNPLDTLKLDVEQLFDLVIQNNPTLKISEENIDVAKQNVKVSKSDVLPNVTTSVSGFYLSDVDIYTPGFKKEFTQDMPHFGNNASIEANQLLWKGGLLRENIKLSELQADIAALQYTSSEQQARLTALGYYLDLFKLYNQSRVYEQNIHLAEQRLENIRKFADQGMVTRNDVIRGELMISNLQLSKLTIDNNITILNKQLNVAVGLPENTVIMPDDRILGAPLLIEKEESYQSLALDNNPNILLSKKAVNISESSLKLAKKNWYPSISAFAGNALQRPLTSSTPAMDMYYNTWNAGLAISFDIHSLWKNNSVVALRKNEINKARAQQEEIEAFIEVGIKTAYIRHTEAVVQNKTLATNMELAEENYRIMETKYNNQLAIILDLFDAANAKLDAELQYANSEINIIYAYYKLLKEAGRI